MTHTPEEIAKAKALAARIEAKVADLLAPMDLEMRIMEWKPEFRVIMWEAIGRKALERARKAAKE